MNAIKALILGALLWPSLANAEGDVGSTGIDLQWADSLPAMASSEQVGLLNAYFAELGSGKTLVAHPQALQIPPHLNPNSELDRRILGEINPHLLSLGFYSRICEFLKDPQSKKETGIKLIEELNRLREEKLKDVLQLVTTRISKIEASASKGELRQDELLSAIEEVRKFSFYGSEINQVIDPVRTKYLKSEIVEMQDSAGALARQLAGDASFPAEDDELRNERHTLSLQRVPGVSHVFFLGRWGNHHAVAVFTDMEKLRKSIDSKRLPYQLPGSDINVKVIPGVKSGTTFDNIILITMDRSPYWQSLNGFDWDSLLKANEVNGLHLPQSFIKLSVPDQFKLLADIVGKKTLTYGLEPKKGLLSAIIKETESLKEFQTIDPSLFIVQLNDLKQLVRAYSQKIDSDPSLASETNRQQKLTGKKLLELTEFYLDLLNAAVANKLLTKMARPYNLKSN